MRTGNGRFRRPQPMSRKRRALRFSMAEAWSVFASHSHPEDGLVQSAETEVKTAVEQREEAKGESQ